MAICIRNVQSGCLNTLHADKETFDYILPFCSSLEVYNKVNITIIRVESVKALSDSTFCLVRYGLYKHNSGDPVHKMCKVGGAFEKSVQLPFIS